MTKKHLENSELFHTNSEKSKRFQCKSEKSTCLFKTLMQLFHSRSFDGIVPETPTKPKQAIPFMAHSSYVILLKKNYDTKGSVAAKSITENTLFSGDHLDILRESIHTESVDLLSLALHSCL